MKNYKIGNYMRISKRAAKKIWNNGENETVIYFCPVNLRPGWPWNPEIAFYKTGENFEKSVAAFEYYNCTCNETGRYTAFYIMED